MKTKAWFLTAMLVCLAGGAKAQTVISNFPAASSVSSTDKFLLQQGGATVPYTYATLGQLGALYLPLSGGTIAGTLTVGTGTQNALTITPGASSSTAATLGVSGTAGLALPPTSLPDRASVLTYGAIGNGTANDTSAIQAAINASAGKAVVVLPAGYTFMVSGLTLPSNTQIEINGTLDLIADSSAESSVLTIDANANNVVIEGTGTINGNKASQTGTGTSAGITTATASGTNIWVRGITITNVLNWPINLTGVDGAWLSYVTATNSGNSVEFAVGAHNVWADHLNVSGINDEDFAFYGGVYDGGISNSDLSGATAGSGISILNDSSQPAPVHDIVVANNIVHGNSLSGIEVNEGTGGGGANYNITIIGNRVYGNNTSNGAATGDIDLGVAQTSSAVGNTLGPSGTGTVGMNGIEIGSASNTLTISGNTIFNEGTGSTNGVGIQDGGAANVLIDGNHIYDNQATKTMAFAINGTAGADTSLVGNWLGPTIGTPDNLTTASDTVVMEAPAIGGAPTVSPGMVVTGSGVEVGAPTGGIGGAGTVNAQSLEVNGAPLTPTFSATSASIGGTALAAGACSTTATTVTGAAVGMAVIGTPNTYPGAGNVWNSYVSAANTVTTEVCAIVAATPVASTYNIRVLQ